MSLVKTSGTVQTDYSGGMFRGIAPHLIPETGLYDLQNYLCDDDGSIYGRGGNEVVNTTDAGGAIRFLWTGYLGPGIRTVFADSSDFFTLDGSNANVNLGGAGLSAPTRAVEVGGMLLIGGGVLYGGSRKSADYSGTNNAAVTNGSKTVTKASGGFTANVDAGMLMRFDAAGRYYVIASVDSDTQVTLRDAYEGSTDGTIDFVASRLGVTSASPYRTGIFWHCEGRALSLETDKLYFSGFTTDNKPNPHSWGTTDYHELPEGVKGIGLYDVRDLTLVFTTRGMFVITGIENDLTDSQGNVQHRLDHVAPDLILWGNEGIATWGNAAVVPAVDGVWLVDGVSTPTRISDAIPDLIRTYVRRGYKPGIAAVHNGHYFLPILSSANVTKDLLVCRLDRGFAWSRITGTAGTVSALAQSVDASAINPSLYAAQNDTAGRITDLASIFAPEDTDGQDWDNTNFTREFITRDFGTGGIQKNLVKRGRIRYEMSGDSAMALSYSTGARPQGTTEWGEFDWGEADWGSPGAPFISIDQVGEPDPEGDDPLTFTLGARCRYIRIKSTVTQPTTRLYIRSLELKVRPTGKDR